MVSRNKKGEISTLVILGTLAVIGVATLLTSSFSTKKQTVETQAQASSCPFDSGQGVQLGQTETDVSNMEPRTPISSNRHEYDFFSYFEPATLDEAKASNLNPLSLDQYTSYADSPGGSVDSKMNGFMGKMFGYKPTKLADAFFMKYKSGTPKGNDTSVKGNSPALKVPTTPGAEIRMPDTGYSIGGDKEAMVTFAASDRITLHIGRHEYFAGSGGNNCKGGPCSGGYWIYIRGICVDQQIVNKYNEIKSAQESAGADKNPIQLPMIEAGRVVGKATGDSVDVIVRDNGPLISIYKPVYWEGVGGRDVGTVPTTPPGQGGGDNTKPTSPATKPSLPNGIPQSPTPTTAPVSPACGHLNTQCCNPGQVGQTTSCYDSGTQCYGGLNLCLNCAYENGPCCNGFLCDSSKNLICVDTGSGLSCQKIITGTPVPTVSTAPGVSAVPTTRPTSSPTSTPIPPATPTPGPSAKIVSSIKSSKVDIIRTRSGSGRATYELQNASGVVFSTIYKNYRESTTNFGILPEFVNLEINPDIRYYVVSKLEIDGTEVSGTCVGEGEKCMVAITKSGDVYTGTFHTVTFEFPFVAVSPTPAAGAASVPRSLEATTFTATEDIIGKKCPADINSVTMSFCIWIP